jgi:hypothetical protein
MDESSGNSIYLHVCEKHDSATNRTELCGALVPNSESRSSSDSLSPYNSTGFHGTAMSNVKMGQGFRDMFKPSKLYTSSLFKVLLGLINPVRCLAWILHIFPCCCQPEATLRSKVDGVKISCHGDQDVFGAEKYTAVAVLEDHQSIRFPKATADLETS